MLVRAFDELLQRRDQIVGGDRIGGRTQPDVIDAFENHEPLDARLRQHIAIEAGQRVDARAVAQKAITRDALVQHGDVRAARSGQPAEQETWPTMIGVRRRDRAIGDGVSKSHNRRSVGSGGNIDVRQEIERLRGRSIGDGCLPRCIAFLGNVGGVQSDGVHGVSPTRCRVRTDAHSKIARDGDVQDLPHR